MFCIPLHQLKSLKENFRWSQEKIQRASVVPILTEKGVDIHYQQTRRDIHWGPNISKHQNAPTKQLL